MSLSKYAPQKIFKESKEGLIKIAQQPSSEYSINFEKEVAIEYMAAHSTQFEDNKLPPALEYFKKGQTLLAKPYLDKFESNQAIKYLKESAELGSHLAHITLIENKLLLENSDDINRKYLNKLFDKAYRIYTHSARIYNIVQEPFEEARCYYIASTKHNSHYIKAQKINLLLHGITRDLLDGTKPEEYSPIIIFAAAVIKSEEFTKTRSDEKIYFQLKLFAMALHTINDSFNFAKKLSQRNEYPLFYRIFFIKAMNELVLDNSSQKTYITHILHQKMQYANEKNAIDNAFKEFCRVYNSMYPNVENTPTPSISSAYLTENNNGASTSDPRPSTSAAALQPNIRDASHIPDMPLPSAPPYLAENDSDECSQISSTNNPIPAISSDELNHVIGNIGNTPPSISPQESLTTFITI